MKFSLSSRQQPEYLQKCDEIRVLWNDRKVIFDLVEKYPDKTINLCRFYIHANDNEIDWKEMNNYKALCKENFVLGLSYIDELEEAKNYGIKCYYLEPVTTFRDLRALKNLGVEWALIDAPLFFQMDKVKACGVPLRATANMAMRKLLPHEDGVPGPWIRPEDLHMYNDYIDTIEFGRVNLDQERALYRIYAEQRNWPGDLGLIIQDLNHTGVNRMIHSSVTERRLNCGQRCQETDQCHLCWRALDLADPDLIREYQTSTK